MSDKLLRLHFTQLERAWNSSVNNSYSDALKKTHHDFLATIYSKLSDEFAKNDSKIYIRQTLYKSLIDFLFKNIDYLDSSTLSIMPFELVKCLEFALADWCKEDEKIMILTKESHKMEEFLFDNSLFENRNFTTALLSMGIYDKSNLNPVLIAFPRYLINDYLGSVALYHELGHYVDIRFNISKRVHNEILKQIQTNKLEFGHLQDLFSFFPFLEDQEDRNKLYASLDKGEYNFLFLRHIQEFFADLFAAQYVDDCLVDFLDYLVNEQDVYSPIYPSLSNRKRAMHLLLENKSFKLLDFLNAALKSATQQEIGREESLKIRYEKFSTPDLFNLLPAKIEGHEKKKVHYLFKLGWDIWKGDWQKIADANQFNFTLDATQVSQIVNNLIEKSISNVLIESNWKTAKHK